MKNKLILLLVLLSVYKINAQSLANYTSVRNTSIVYSSISGVGTPISFWRNTTINQNDDNRSISIPIGFDFWYLGSRYTTVSVCSNGYIDFSTTVYDGNDTPGFPSGSGYVACGGNYSYRESPINFYSFGCGAAAPNYYDGTYLALAPFYTDLWVGNAGANAIANSIKYNLSGTAPNRVFTVEYINMDDWQSAAVSDYNFQVKLYESSGVIEFVYGTMAPSIGGTPAYGCGLNSIITSGSPSAAQLKMQQTANSNTFNNTPQAALTTAPTSNSRLTFSPPCPASPIGALTINAITSSGMTLNWPNWAANEVAYAIYSSVDNITFNYFAQTAANATSFAATNLLPTTTYYWRVMAVTEGCISTPLNANATTLTGANKISNQTGNWSNANIWTPNGVPTSGDNVTIANGHVVTINTAAVCHSLTVGQGAAATLQFNGGTVRSLTLGNRLTVNTNASFIVNAGSNATHSLITRSNIVSNGTINLHNSATSRCNTFISNNIGNINFTGTGTTSNFSNISVDLLNPTDILTVSSNNFSAVSDFLLLRDGVLRFSTVNAVNITPFNTANTIPLNCGLVLNSPNLTINTGNNLNILGSLSINSGTLNIGNASNEDLQVSGGSINMAGGVLNVASKLYAAGINDIFNLNMTGGTINVPTIGSTNTTISPFNISGTGSIFNQSNGQITILRSGGTGAQNLGYQISGSVSGSVSGGILQIGSALTSGNHTIQINSIFPVGNLILNSNLVAAAVTTNSLNILNNLTVNSGTLNANSLNIQVAGSWSNASLFNAGSGNVIFNSNSAQTISRSLAGGETFNNILFSGSGAKTFASAVTASGNFSINTGSNADVSASNFQLTVRGNFINNGTFNARNGLVFLNGSTAQTIGGTSISSFNNLTLTNNAGATLTNSINLISTLTLSNGNFGANGFLTLISTSAGTARIDQITGSGDISGNVTVQRFVPGGTTGWALLGTPISSGLTFEAWDDDLPISCPTCPDGYASNFHSIYSYDETSAGSFSSSASYIPINNITDPIVAGRGYWVYLGNGQFTTTDITIDVTGNVRKFNYNIPITYNNFGAPTEDGWNLIHNPYPSAISWSALRGSTPNIDDAIYCYNADLNGGLGGNATYINGVSSPAVGSGGIGNVIPMGQGFYVHSTGATALNATEAIKVSGNPTFLKAENQQAAPPLLRLFLNGANNFNDETVLYIQNGATADFDNNYDAYKLAGQDIYAPQLNLEYNSKNFQVNGVPPIAGSFSMDLKALSGYPGSYTISASNVATFPTGACINLFDKFTLTTTDLKTSDYVFNLSDTTTISRFVLNITINTLPVNSNVTQPTCQLPLSNQIICAGTNSGPWNYYWKDQIGNVVKTSLNKTIADTLTNLQSGTYNLEINTVGQCDNNDVAFFINQISLPVAQFNSVDTLFNVSQNGSVTFTNTSINSISQQWSFGDNSGTSNLISPNYNYASAGIYAVSLIVNSISGCSDTTYKTIVVLDAEVGLNSYFIDKSILIKTISENNYIISLNFDTQKYLQATLQDNLGKEVLNYESTLIKNKNLDIQLNNLPSGIYYLKLNIDGQLKTIKLVANN